MEPNADIGLVGLAVMGQNLDLNMNDNGYAVAVFNSTSEKVKSIIGEQLGVPAEEVNDSASFIEDL